MEDIKALEEQTEGEGLEGVFQKSKVLRGSLTGIQMERTLIRREVRN